MNGLDIAVLAIVVLSVLLGFIKGFVRELFAVAGVVVSAFGGITLAPLALRTFGFEETGVSFVVASVVLFAVFAIGLAVLEHLLKRILDALYLGGLNRLLGGVFGLARGAVVTCLSLTALVLALDPDSDLLRESHALRVAAPVVSWIGTRLPWEPARISFSERWDALEGQVAGPRTSTDSGLRLT